MERLLPSDPSRLGEHRLLGRLGAGGMGVVYLARTEAGELAAVKVIQPEYAEEAEFRTRFRREVAAARQVVNPWVVRVTGADAEARAPWLATAFVPGPSLAEAVAACGPLPLPAVRVLGGMLARALTAVHAAGLVHRDVKPGNVLLALDGPRLIDFGIARSTSAEETALTSESVIVGTPGFLSPEQARAGRIEPASDLFSLGCVLAYAATGRPPFGTGAVDALLYRTVHDEPDLDGIDAVEGSDVGDGSGAVDGSDIGDGSDVSDGRDGSDLHDLHDVHDVPHGRGSGEGSGGGGGSRGTDGADGASGADADADGAEGASGADGADGADGAVGADGADGTAGFGGRGLRALLERCLAKDPADRPTAAEVAEALTAQVPAGSVDWLPDAVVRTIADRSAELLALPPVEPTEISGTPDAPPPRRRFLALAAGGAALVAAGGGTALWAVLGDGANGRRTPAARRWTIGVQADLTGPQKAAGQAQERAARLAVEQFNSRKDKPFTLTVEAVDDQGSAAGAQSAAKRLTGDRDVLAVVGPTGWASAQAAVKTYEGAGLPLLTVSELSLSSTNSALVFDPQVYFRAGPLITTGGFMTDVMLSTLGTRRIGLIVDRAGRLTGWETSDMAYRMAAKLKLELYDRFVPAAAPDPAVVLADMFDHGVDGLYYSGTPERAALVARALAERGFDGPRFLDPPAATDAFTAAAGRAADGWQVLAPFVTADAPAVRTFVTAYRERFGAAPGIWAPEAYDVTRLVIDRLTALRAQHGRRPSREQLAAALLKADFKGLTTTYAFEKDRTLRLSHLYHLRVADGRFRYVGLAPLDG